MVGKKSKNRLVAKRNLKNPMVRGGAIATAILAETHDPPHTNIAKMRSAYDTRGLSGTGHHQASSLFANAPSIKENELSVK